MLLRYVELMEYVLGLDAKDFDALLLRQASNKRVKNLIKKLGDLEEVKNNLQHRDATNRATLRTRRQTLH